MDVIRLSYEKIDQHRERLNQAAAAGTLTEEMLDEAVRLVVDPPRNDYLPNSIGGDWIRNHIDGFTKAVLNPLVFLRRHFENEYFTPLVVLRSELLQLLPQAERVSYVRDSIMRYGPWNTGWIGAALQAGVSRGELAQIVLDRLAITPPPEYGRINFIRSFLEHGGGRLERTRPFVDEWQLVEKDTEWAVLDAEQFARAIDICVEKAPADVFRQYHKIRARLDGEALKQVMVAALDKIDSLRHLDLAVLRTLPIETRVAMARRLKLDEYGHDYAVAAQFLVELILIQGIFLYEEVLSAFEQMNAAVVYRHTYSMLVEAEKEGGQKKATADALEALLADRCRAAGYYFGIIEESTYTNQRTRRSQVQKVVQDGSMTYVQDGMQHRYFPKVGEAVLFKPSQGHQLTPRVTAVMFYPACHGGEV